jgi:hypothetical protein
MATRRPNSIWGERDRIIPIAHGYAAHAAVPGSRLEVLAAVRHFPHVGSPTAVVDIVDDFIATTGTVRAWRGRGIGSASSESAGRTYILVYRAMAKLYRP